MHQTSKFVRTSKSKKNVFEKLEIAEKVQGGPLCSQNAFFAEMKGKHVGLEHTENK